MARGYIGGRRGLQFDPSAFLQGGGGDKGDTAMKMAMQLMGYGRGASPEELGLSREKLLADIAGQTGTQDIARQNLDIERQRLGSQEAFQNWQKKAEQERALAELGTKNEQAGAEKSKSRDLLIGKYLDLETDAAKRRSLIDALSPEAKADTLALEGAKQTAAAKALLPQLQVAYEKGDVNLIKQLTEGKSPELLSRPEFEWQKWNQGMVPASQRGISSGGGLLGALWNVPMATQNLIRGGLNVGGKVLLGEQAPEFAYGKYTKPSLEGVDTSKIRAVISQALQLGVPGVGEPGQAQVAKENLQSIPGGVKSVLEQTLGADRRFPAVDARDYSKFPGSVEDLIAASRQGPPPVEPRVGVDDLARLVAPAINAGQPATGGEEELLNQRLASSVAPTLSAIQESQYAPPAAFPRQMRQPGFEYQPGGPSAVPGRWLQPERERYPTGAAGPLDWRAILGL